MSRENIKTSQVAFNLLDPDQKQMYMFVKSRTNESAYLKRLIQRDMDMENGSLQISKVEEESRQQNISRDVLKGFI